MTEEELQKEIESLRKERKQFFEDTRIMLAQQRGFLNTFLNKTDKHDRKIDKAFLNMHKEIVRLNTVVEAVSKTNECVEESLCNVLLAIRQNEYLQAWYPEQSGFPEMKVTGIHPANIKE